MSVLNFSGFWKLNAGISALCCWWWAIDELIAFQSHWIEQESCWKYWVSHVSKAFIVHCLQNPCALIINTVFSQTESRQLQFFCFTGKSHLSQKPELIWKAKRQKDSGGEQDGFILPFLQFVKLKFPDIKTMCRQAFFHYNFIHNF